MKTKALISCAVTAQLICVFVFAYAKSRFSHHAAQIIVPTSEGNFVKNSIGYATKSKAAALIHLFNLQAREYRGSLGRYWVKSEKFRMNLTFGKIDGGD